MAAPRKLLIVRHSESFGFITDKGVEVPLYIYFEDEAVRRRSMKRITKAHASAIAEALVDCGELVSGERNGAAGPIAGSWKPCASMVAMK